MVRLVDENEVTKKAYEQAAAIIDSAKKTSKDMRLGAMEYAESVLADAEGKLKERNPLFTAKATRQMITSRRHWMFWRKIFRSCVWANDSPYPLREIA